MTIPPPLPPEPDWAPPPRSITDFERPPEAVAALRAARRTAKGAGVVAFGVAAVALFAGASPLGAWAQLGVLLVGGAVVAAIAGRARRAGLPVGEVVTTVVVAFALSLAITAGVVFTVALGACLILLGSR